MNRITGFLLLVSIIAGLLAGLSLAYFAFVPARPGANGPQDSMVMLVKKGQNAHEIAKILAKNNIITNPRKFLWLGRLIGKADGVKLGEYQIGANMSPLQIWSTITSGISVGHPVTVREGENMYEVAVDLESKGLAKKSEFLAFCRNPRVMHSLGFKDPLPASLEGYLYPETYFLNRSMNAEEIVHLMVRKFNTVWTEQDSKRAAELGMTKQQVVTLASMIEKETGVPQERVMISSIFHNRLKKRMRLQSDPTIIYGIWDRYHGNLHKSDLLYHTPYNTYTIPALPLGPISNPGKDAIHAALYPSESKYLFFVSHNDGTHEFTENLKAHEAAVRKFQVDPKAREGKSWRDYGKKMKAGGK